MVNGDTVQEQLNRNAQRENDIADQQARLALGRTRSIRDFSRIIMQKGNF